MNGELLQKLQCLDCASPLRVEETSVGGPAVAAVEPSLCCTNCRQHWPIVRGVPRFVAADNYAAGFGLQWNTHATTQYDSANGTTISRDRLACQTRWPARLDGECVLEVGSGSGRFTEQIAATGAAVVSAEFSSAVDANQRGNGDRANVLVIQADLYDLPLAPSSFDRVLCIGVLQHTPDPARAFASLARFVKPGGQLVIDVYRRPRGVERLVKTRYWIRPVTRRISPQRLYRLTRAYVTFMWPLASLVHRIPWLGRRINWALQIADYRGIYALSEAQLKEWAILDTFDMLAPKYDSPQDEETVQQWFEAAGFERIEVGPGPNGIDGRGWRRHA